MSNTVAVKEGEKLVNHDGLFERYPEHPNPNPYAADMTKYSQVNRPFKDKPGMAFGSKDAARRDEFTSGIRTSQYREQIRTEDALYRKQLTSSLRLAGASIATPPGSARSSGSAPLGSPMRSRRQDATAGLRAMVQSLEKSLGSSGMSRSRDFTAKTQFDRLRDQRTAEELYHTRAVRTGKEGINLGPHARESDSVGHGVVGSPHHAPEWRKKSVVREFYRSNGVSPSDDT